MSFGLMWIVVLLGIIAHLLLLRNLGNIHCQYEFSLNENRTIPTQSGLTDQFNKIIVYTL